MSDLLYEVKDKVATITLNRPDKLNAFTGDMIDAWQKSLAEAQRDDNVNVVIVTGAGRAFCSGGDVGRMRSNQYAASLGGRSDARAGGHGDADEPTVLDGKNGLWEGVHRIPKQLEQMDKPVIAMVNGLAVGAGMGMCVMCDVRIAAESARFSSGYVRVGLVPGDGDTFFLPRLVGPAKALELLRTADFIEAPEAHRLGIVQRVVPDAKLHDETYALARQIADGPQVPIRMIKRLVYQSLKLDLRTHLDLVSSHMAIVRQTADHAEGVAAFKEKRPAKFRGV
jgi:enoyl-CoA hydratase/carnithine racemase